MWLARSTQRGLQLSKGLVDPVLLKRSMSLPRTDTLYLLLTCTGNHCIRAGRFYVTRPVSARCGSSLSKVSQFPYFSSGCRLPTIPSASMLMIYLSWIMEHVFKTRTLEQGDRASLAWFTQRGFNLSGISGPCLAVLLLSYLSLKVSMHNVLSSSNVVEVGQFFIFINQSL